MTHRHAVTCPTGKVSRVAGRGSGHGLPLYRCHVCGDLHAFTPSGTAGAKVKNVRRRQAQARDAKRLRRAARRHGDEVDP